MDNIKLARKRKSTKSEKVTDDFFLKYSKWKTSSVDQLLDTSPNVEYTQPTQQISSTPPQPESTTYFHERADIDQIQPTPISEYQPVQKDINYDSEFSTQANEVSNDYPTSAVEFLKETVVQNELGTFGIDEKSSQSVQSSEITEKPKLFDQLTEALETSDSPEPKQTVDYVNHPAEIPKQEIISTDDRGINIDVLSSKIGNLLKEVETIKSTKVEEYEDVVDDSQIEPSIPLTDPFDKNESKEEIPFEESLDSITPPSNVESEEKVIDVKPDSKIKAESQSEDAIMSSLRSKISEVMNFTEQISSKFKEEPETLKVESASMEKEISPPKFQEVVETKFEKDQETILKTRSSGKAPLNKEKLESVLELLKDEEKSLPDTVSSPEITRIEEIKEVKLKISRMYHYNPKDDSLDVKIIFENKLKKGYNQDYEINQTTPEGWKADQHSLFFMKNKNLDEKDYKLYLKEPLTEWRLSTGKFEHK